MPRFKLERANNGFNIYDMRGEGYGPTYGAKVHIGWCRDDQVELFEHALGLEETYANLKRKEVQACS